jgi:hypothetical protein
LVDTLSPQQPSAASPARSEALLAILMLVLPFFFIHWGLPFVSHTTFGNDYQWFATPQQMEVQFSIAKGSFPLYVPGFAGGQSVQALMQGQTYHPISLVAPHLPGYWSGHAAECNTLLRLLSLGLAHLALFVMLRALGLGRGFAFLLGTVTTYNLRMLDLFRYAAALESWTGHLFLCAFVGLLYVRRPSVGVRAGVIVASYWLVTSGHPQMAYYGFLSALLFALLVPFLAAALEPGRPARKAEVGRFWASVAGLMTLGLLLSAAFAIPFVTDFFISSPRAGRDFAWALSPWRDSLVGTLDNFFLPLRSDVHGAFGGSSLILLAALLPALALFRVRIPVVVWAAWGLALVVFLALQGARTPVYRVIWQILPLASSMRAPGRLALLLPILLMTILAWLFHAVERSAGQTEPGLEPRALVLLGGSGLVVWVSYLALLSRLSTAPTIYSPVSIRHVSWSVESAIVVCGLAALSSFALLLRLPRWRDGLFGVLCVATCLQSKLVLDHGTWEGPTLRTPTFAEMEHQKRERLDYRFASGETTYTDAMWRQSTLFHVEPALGRVYFAWRSARSLDKALRILGSGVGPDEVVIEGAEGSQVAHAEAAARVELSYSSFNRLVFDVHSSDRGYFTSSYPYTGHWQAFVGGAAVPPRRANAGNHAVPIPAGHSTVELRYRSLGQTAGWATSGVALVLVVLVLVFPRAGRNKAIASALLVAFAAAGLLALRSRSLYAGDNLGTRFVWSGPGPTPARPNLAYGRPTTASSILAQDHNCCPFVSGKATDGDTSNQSRFTSEVEDSPRWGVDLGGLRRIGSVVAYEPRHDASMNLRPMLVATSRDGRTWVPATRPLAERDGKLVLDLRSPIEARFLLVQASGRCRLSLNEVQVFPPEP